METITNSEELRRALGSRNRSGIGFVPTMGALHAGHRSLVERARRECATVVVSVFVNPTQFNDKTDLKNYPRTPEADLRLLEEVGADYVFMPSVEEVYPEPDTRTFDFGMIDKVMEGATRPGHFNGVAQVVSRLFDKKLWAPRGMGHAAGNGAGGTGHACDIEFLLHRVHQTF